jgi:pyruvate dehydrogenase E2 component (dihydrolipoamide acetyltransferase)
MLRWKQLISTCGIRPRAYASALLATWARTKRVRPSIASGVSRLDPRAQESQMIRLPILTPGMEHGLLAKWRVKPGDVIRVGDVIAEIETDKATIEMEAPVEGVIEEICVPEGTSDVKVSAILARMRGDVVTDSEHSRSSVDAMGSSLPGPNDAIEVIEPGHVEATSAAAGITRRNRVFASPVARRIARASKVDLSCIAGSGPRGRIIRRDVESVLHSDTRRPASAPDQPPVQPMSSGRNALAEAGILPGSYDLVPLDPMRKVIARRMTEAFRDIPHFPLTIDVRVDELQQLRSRINTTTGIKVSVNDMIVKAAAAALMRVPAANASYTSDGIAMHRDADICVAVAIEGGLITPIVRAAQTKSLSHIAQEMKELSEQARSKRLKPEQFRGGTFSVSNLGMLGIRSFASILNPPQGCIMSVGAAEQRVIAVEGVPSIAWMMTVTLTCDHRVVDGAVGARFLAAFRECIESPVALLV